ncbi:rhophilin-2-like [Bemisia tabaci]|uniref:rhophilin-2-like n=1 Tax=Bemisia tabaci TaxID=7038 RepID=UPI003B28CB2A
MFQAMRTPNRDNSGIALLFQYYNQLYFVERRFFPPDRSLGIYFEWYDSLTGVPSCQKTVAFEKACVLFNMAAVYTQIGAKQDRLTEKGLDQAVDSFLRAAGTYTYIQENFTNAPSMDLAPHMLDMLVHLMLAQARECLFEKLELQSEEKRNMDVWLDLAQESAQLAQVYETVHSLITMTSVQEYVPYSWVSLVQVKEQHYAGLAHFHSAVALLSKSLAQFSERSIDMLHYLHVESDFKTPSHIKLDSDERRKHLGKAHLKSALQLLEESQRLQRMCRELRSKKALSRVLAKTVDNVKETLADTEEDDAFSEILEAPCIQPSTKFQLSLTPPDFAHLPVEDLFKQLGPVAIFSAKHHWTAPRSVRLQRRNSHDTGFGFSVRGDSPVIVAAVDQGSLAHFGGMKEGDFIVAIGNHDVKWSQHDHVVKLIKEAGDSLSLKLVSPMDKNYLKSKLKLNPGESGCGSSTNSSCNGGTNTQGDSPNGSVNTHRKLTWNPFKKHRERETSFNFISR